jgi:hypothetical protein
MFVEKQSSKHSKYVANQTLEYFLRIIWLFGFKKKKKKICDFLRKVFISTLAILYYETKEFPCDDKLMVSIWIPTVPGVIVFVIVW